MIRWKPTRGSDLGGEIMRESGARVMEMDKPKEPLPADPWEFLTRCVWTQDEHAVQRGLKVVRPLVRDGDDYLEILTRELTTEPQVAMTKARQMRVTWMLSALFVHDILTHPGHRLGYQVKKWDDAAAYLRDRMWFIYRHIPKRYAVPKARHIEGSIEVFHGDDTEIPTAWVMALGEGAAMARQWTFSWFWSDEFAWQVDQEDTMTAIQPSLDGGGRHTMTSTPARGTYMAKVLFEDVAAGKVEAEAEIYRDSIVAWRRNGYRCLRVEYWADPHKEAQWPDRNQPAPGYSERRWKQEQRNDWSVWSGQPVYADTDRIITTPQLYLPNELLLRLWDFGWNTPVCLFAQARVTARTTGKQLADGRWETELRPSFHVLMEMSGSGVAIGAFGEAVLQRGKEYFPGAKYMDFGDPAGNAKEGVTGRSAIQALTGLNIHVRTETNKAVDKDLDGMDLVQELITLRDLEVDPKGCPRLLEDLRGGYHRDELGQIVKDDIHDHRPDGLRYGVRGALRFAPASDKTRLVLKMLFDPSSARAWTGPPAVPRRNAE